MPAPNMKGTPSAQTRRTEALGIAGHRGWMTAELDEGEMGGEEARQRRREKAQPPPVFQATGPTSQTGAGRAPTERPRRSRAREAPGDR